MTVEIIGILVFALAAIALWRGSPAALDVFMASAVLGAAAAVTFPALGGIGVQPAHCLLFLVVVPLSMSPGFLGRAGAALRFPRPGFWLCLAVAYGVVGAALLPRLFANATSINGIGVGSEGLAAYATPLGPTSGNVTQTLYFAADLLCFATASSWARTERGRAAVFRGALAYAVANIAFALVDLASFWVGTPEILDLIRNSNYVLLTETVTLGLKRIAGSFSEASAFAYASVGAYAFLTSLWLRGVRPRLTGPLALVQFCLLLASASTTAYVALPIASIFIYAGEAWRLAERRASAQSLVYLILAPLFVLAILGAVALWPDASDRIGEILNVLIFDKDSSDSGVERSAWNQFAWWNFLDTYGFGAGLGSARASSLLFAVLANLGAFGGLAYAIFLLGVLTQGRESAPREPQTAAIAGAAQSACLAWLVAAVLSASLVDLGLIFFAVAGLSDGIYASSLARTSAVGRHRAPMRRTALIAEAPS